MLRRIEETKIIALQKLLSILEKKKNTRKKDISSQKYPSKSWKTKARNYI